MVPPPAGVPHPGAVTWGDRLLGGWGFAAMGGVNPHPGGRARGAFRSARDARSSPGTLCRPWPGAVPSRRFWPTRRRLRPGGPCATASAATPPRLPRRHGCRSPPHASLAGGTSEDVHGEAARQQLRPRAVPAGWPRSVGLGARRGRLLRGRFRRDAGPPRAGGREHARVAHGVEARRRHASGQAAQQRQRVHVHRDRPVGVRLLQGSSWITATGGSGPVRGG
jgi:hypothetical protein